MLHQRPLGEPIALERDVTAILVPDGNEILLSKGSQVTIQQELGGSYTVRTDLGFMARIDGKDADAIGREIVESEVQVDPGDVVSVEKAIWEALRTCYDPEIPVNIVELGLIYGCKLRTLADVPLAEREGPPSTLGPAAGAPASSPAVSTEAGASDASASDDSASSEATASSEEESKDKSEEKKSLPGVPAATQADLVPPAEAADDESEADAGQSGTEDESGLFAEIEMTLTAPACGMGPVLQQDVQRKVEAIPGVSKVRVDIVFDPPWSYDKMSEAARLELGML